MDGLAILLSLLLVAYLIGAVPFGVVACRVMGLPDPRTAGSRNIGFTNVLRMAGKKAGLLTLLGDMGKGWLAGWAAGQWIGDPWAVLAVAFAAVLGHLFPVFLGFKGGKGVATALGAVAGVAPAIGGVLVGTWLVVAAVWRYSSGAAISAFVLLPVIALWKAEPSFLVFSLGVSGLILYRHRANMARLWAGTEPKIGTRSRHESGTAPQPSAQP